MKKRWSLLYAASTLLTLSPLEAADFTWTGDASTQFDLSGNWTPALPTQPPSVGDRVIFAKSTSSNYTPILSSGGSFALYEALFNEEDSVFTISVNTDSTLTFGISGETTSSSTSGVSTSSAPDGTQTFSISNGGKVYFYGLSSANTNEEPTVIYNVGHTSSGTMVFQDQAKGGHAELSVGTTTGTASVTFEDSSSAGNAEIIIGDDSSSSARIGTITFRNNASAGEATITVTDTEGESTAYFRNNSTLYLGRMSLSGLGSFDSKRGTLIFYDNSSAGGLSPSQRSVITVGDILGLSNTSAATVFYDSTTAGYSSIFVADHLGDSTLDFYATSTASNADIYIGSFGLFTKPVSGTVTFHDSSTAENATFNIGDPDAESALYFRDNSTAADSSILIGLTDTDHLGKVAFYDSSSAGNAAITAHNASTVDFYAGSSSGNCSITLANGAIATFHGEGSYTVSSLVTDATSIISIPSATLTLNFNGETPIEIAGAITNDHDGSFVKDGTGTVTLSGANTYKGGTTVEEGELILTGSLLSGLTVNGGTFSGNGSITGSATINGGTFSGSGSVSDGITLNGGTLILSDTLDSTITFSGDGTLVGDYTSDLGGSFSLAIENYTNEVLTVTGSAALGDAPLTVTLVGEKHLLNTPHTVLTTTDGVSGEFAEPTFDFAAYGLNSNLLAVTPSYTSDEAFVTLQTTLVNAGGSAQGVAKQLDSITNPTIKQSLVLEALASESNPSAANALKQVSGEQYTNFLFTAGRVQQQFFRNLYEPVRDLICIKQEESCCKRKISTWVAASGGHSLLKNKKGFQGMSMNSYEITLGAHSTFFGNLTLGLATTYEHDSIDYRLSGKGSNDNWLGGIYSLYRPESFYLITNFIGGYSSNTLKRYIRANNTTWAQRSTPDQSQLGLYSEAGFDYHTRSSLIQPFLGVQAGHVHQNAVHEHSHAALDLNFEKKIQNSVASRLGFHITGAAENCLLFGLDIAWQYRFTKESSSLQASFANFGEGFKVKGVSLARNSVDGALFANAPIFGCWRIFTKLSGQLWKGANSYNLLGGVEASW